MSQGETRAGKWPAYPEYKASGVEWLGEVPAHWKVKPVKRIGRIRYGLGEPPELAEDGIPFLRATDIKQGRIGLETALRVDPNEVPWSRRPQLQVGEILVVRSGAYTGDSALVAAECKGCIAGYDMVLTLQSAVPRFTAWTFLSKYVVESQFEIARSRAAQPHLNADDLASALLALPSMGEQEGIADFLDAKVAKIDALIAKKRELIDRLNEKRKALISRTVIRGLPPDAALAAGLDPNPPLKPTGVEWIGDVPQHWDLTRLRRCATIQTGVTLGKEYPETLSESRPYLRVANVQDGYLDLAEIKETVVLSADASRFELRAGDVLMTEGGDFDKLGRGCVWHGQIAGCLHQNHIFAVRPDTRMLVAEYLSLAMTSGVGKHYFTRTAQQSTNLATTNQTKIKDFVFPIPPLSEQRAILDWIAVQVTRFRTIEGRMRDAIAELEEYRSALITAAVTGEIDVRGWRAGPTSAPRAGA